MKFQYILFFFLSIILSSFINPPAPFLAAQTQTKSLIIDNKMGDFPLMQVPTFSRWNTDYISLNDFAVKTGFGIYTNDARQKVVLYVSNDKATFTSNNNYVILNDHIYQLLYTPIWQDGELWVPVPMLVELFNSFTAHRFNYDSRELILTLGMKDVNLTKIEIESKDNGTLIKISSTRKFVEKDISLKIANGWLHVDVYGGKVDADNIVRAKTAGVISKIEVIPFEQLVSLAFKLKRRIMSKEVILNNDSNDFFVNLRTNEKIEPDEQAQLELEKQKKKWLIDTIVIDAGHGGRDPGAIGYKGVREKDITLAVALKLGQLISKNMPGVKVVYTRKTDVHIPLRERTQIANKSEGKLFISLHCNSNDDKRAEGFETYFLSAEKKINKRAQDVALKENASISFEKEEDQEYYKGINFILATMAQSAFIRQSQYFASVIQNSCASNLKPEGLKDRGVKQNWFWVMVGATMPNVLIEMGFISNKSESYFLKKSASQYKIAKAIFEGIQKYKKDIEAAI